MDKEQKVIKLIMFALYESNKMIDREIRDLLIRIIYLLESGD